MRSWQDLGAEASASCTGGNATTGEVLRPPQNQETRTLMRVRALPMSCDINSGGAGGNRTPVHQARSARATTIPDAGPDGGPRAGPLLLREGLRWVFPQGQWSCPLSAVFPAVVPRFCCRAAVDRPRVTSRLTMSFDSPEEDQAAKANCSLAVLVCAPFYESEQLGSHVRPADLVSKPISPVVGDAPTA